MNHFTSIEQSKKLLELGLKAETADACYDVGDGQTKAHIECENFTSYFTNDEFPELKDRYIPCWSVGQLLELMPKIKGSKCPKLLKFIKNDKQFYVVSYKRISYTGFYKTPIEVCYETMCWLLENNYLKTK